MKKTKSPLAVMLTLACIVIINMVSISAVNPGPSARGSAQAENILLTFHAVELQDGSVEGRATYRDRAAHTSVDIDIDCMVIFNQPACPAGCGQLGAILSGVVSNSSFPGLEPGEATSFILKEGGKGEFAQPDAYTPPTNGGTCTSPGPILAFHGSERGRITINR